MKRGGVGVVVVVVGLSSIHCGRTTLHEGDSDDDVIGGMPSRGGGEGGAFSRGGTNVPAMGGVVSGGMGGTRIMVGGYRPGTTGGGATPIGGEGGAPLGLAGEAQGGASGEGGEAGDGGEAGQPTLPPFCGDGSVLDGEECDDGDRVDGNGCDADCTPTRVVQLVAGDRFTCALLDSGRVKCWGDNWYGAVGSGSLEILGDEPGEMGKSLPFVDLGPGARVSQLAEGDQSVCALLTTGTIKCWGQNSRGALGVPYAATKIGTAPGQMGDALLPVDLGANNTPTRLAAGKEHVCAINQGGGAVKCWGANTFGQLGLGDRASRGLLEEQMGNALPFVDWGTGRTVRAVAAGLAHTCALLDDFSVKCVGFSPVAGLGPSGFTGDDPGEMGDALPRVDLGTGLTALALAAGRGHTCALLDDESVKCWGLNNQGQLGLGDTTSRGALREQMGNALPIVDLGTGRTATSVVAGTYHTCAILDDATLKCWGSNDGKLGLGDSAARGNAPGTMGDALPAVRLGTGRHAVSLALGTSHTCALLDDGAVKCWGSDAKVLGIGDGVSYGTDPSHMGDALPAVALW
jgi:cysteine-rich repeat protein